MDRICRFKCSDLVKTLRQFSTLQAYDLPTMPGFNNASFVVGTCLPLAFLVRLGTATGEVEEALGAVGGGVRVLCMSVDRTEWTGWCSTPQGAWLVEEATGREIVAELDPDLARSSSDLNGIADELS